MSDPYIDDNQLRMSNLTAFCLGITLGALITLALLFLVSNIMRVERIHTKDTSHIVDDKAPRIFPTAPKDRK